MFTQLPDTSDRLVTQLLGHLEEGIIILLPHGVTSGEPNVKAYVKLHEKGDSLLSTCLDSILTELQKKRHERQTDGAALCQPG